MRYNGAVMREKWYGNEKDGEWNNMESAFIAIVPSD
jgi:hypothetical protein